MAGSRSTCRSTCAPGTPVPPSGAGGAPATISRSASSSEGTDDAPYDERQYEALADLVAALQRAYPSLAEGWIAGHADIAPGRKTDPGPAFDWRQLERAVRARGAAFRREVLA